MFIRTTDGIQLYAEESGSGTPIVFVHEYAGNYRSWERQVGRFSGAYRCVTYSQRGYPPSDVPLEASQYSQDLACGDLRAVLDAMGIERAHVVGHSMGAYTALHLGLDSPERCRSVVTISCGWGSTSDPTQRESLMAYAQEMGEMFQREPIEIAARKYLDSPMRRPFQRKDPTGFERLARSLSEHSSVGQALTLLNVQLKRPTLGDLQDRLAGFQPPLLIVVGEEDELCLGGSRVLERTVVGSELLTIPRSGHTLPLEEPDQVNAALADWFAAADAP